MSEQKENNSLFRDKSLEQFTAPEQLNDYIRVIRPSLILVMVAIIILLAGIVLWGYLGSIDSHEDVTCAVNDGLIHTYISSLSGDCDLPDGVYEGKVIMARIRPISLILG